MSASSPADKGSFAMAVIVEVVTFCIKASEFLKAAVPRFPLESGITLPSAVVTTGTPGTAPRESYAGILTQTLKASSVSFFKFPKALSTICALDVSASPLIAVLQSINLVAASAEGVRVSPKFVLLVEMIIAPLIQFDSIKFR